MINVLAIGAQIELEAIKSALKKNNVQLTLAKFGDIEIILDRKDTHVLHNNKDISDYDFVWLKGSWYTRAFAYALSLYLKSKNIPHTRVESEHSKLVDFMVLALNKINIPTSYFSSTCNIINRIDTIELLFGYPFIIKITRGSLGKGIFLIKDRAHFYKEIKKLDLNENYICQRFIPNNFDYRIIVSYGNKMVSAEKRVRTTDLFRNNAHLGAEEVFMDVEDISADIKLLAINSAKACDLQWTGIDIVTSSKTGRSYILELNRRPGLTAGTTEVSASYDHIIDLLKDHHLITQ